MLAETVTLEMSWKKLLRGWGEKRPRRTERNRAKRKPGENGYGERERNERAAGKGSARGWLPMSSAEKRQSLKHATTYQAVNGIAMSWLFFTWIDFTTRDILPCPRPRPPCPSRRHARSPPPIVPTLAGCGSSILQLLHRFFRPRTPAGLTFFKPSSLWPPSLCRVRYRALNRCL